MVLKSCETLPHLVTVHQFYGVIIVTTAFLQLESEVPLSRKYHE